MLLTIKRTRRAHEVLKDNPGFDNSKVQQAAAQSTEGGDDNGETVA